MKLLVRCANYICVESAFACNSSGSDKVRSARRRRDVTAQAVISCLVKHAERSRFHSVTALAEAENNSSMN